MPDYDKLLKKYIAYSRLNFNDSDEDVSGSLTTQIARRDIYYTTLLKDHQKLTKARGICKEIHKWLFFWLMVAASCVAIYYIHKTLSVVLNSEDINIVVDSIPLIITALVSFISTIIAVPLTIVKFLFNTKEDDNITTLIQHTQDHDSAGINIFKDRLTRKKSNKDTQYINNDNQ